MQLSQLFAEFNTRSVFKVTKHIVSPIYAGDKRFGNNKNNQRVHEDALNSTAAAQGDEADISSGDGKAKTDNDTQTQAGDATPPVTGPKKPVNAPAWRGNA